ncbi:MAG: multiheme c-type cytochrome [Sedimenticola sp.]
MKKNQIAILLNTEINWIPSFLSTLFVAIFSGYATYGYPIHTVWQQWTYLLHTFAGISLSIIALPYIVIHFRRTLGLRRSIVLLSGILASIVFFCLLSSGLHIAIFGQQESLRWIYKLHIFASYLTILCVGLHLAAHRILLPLMRSQTELKWFPSILNTPYTSIALVMTVATILVLISTTLYTQTRTAYSDKPEIEPYQLPFGDHLFRPSQSETITGGFIDKEQIGSSEKCGACHSEISEEWKASMHAQAGSDKAYQTNINLLAKEKGIAATRYCEGCHAPVALLSGELSAGGSLKTSSHHYEGVSCMGCHGINKIVHLKGVASYQFAPASDYLFNNSVEWMASKINNYLIRINPAQHRSDMARSPIGSSKLCATCHSQYMDKETNGWGWVKMQDEYTAWLNSPFSGQSKDSFSRNKEQRCQDCHFPLVPSGDPSADKNGFTRSHRALGANTAIPWYNADYKQLALTTSFLQADKVRISIEEPNRVGAMRSNKPVAPDISTENDAPAYYYLGENVNLNVVVTNSQVGHNFPGGTTDINEVWLYLRVVDAQNRVVFESGHLTKDNSVDAEAYFYGTIPISKDGQQLWRHDLFNMIGDSFKKVISPGDSDITSHKFKIPSWVKSPLAVNAVLRYRKFNNRYARWSLQDDNIDLPIVDMARDSIDISVRIKHEVE